MKCWGTWPKGNGFPCCADASRHVQRVAQLTWPMTLKFPAPPGSQVLTPVMCGPLPDSCLRWHQCSPRAQPKRDPAPDAWQPPHGASMHSARLPDRPAPQPCLRSHSCRAATSGVRCQDCRTADATQHHLLGRRHSCLPGRPSVLACWPCHAPLTQRCQAHASERRACWSRMQPFEPPAWQSPYPKHAQCRRKLSPYS